MGLLPSPQLRQMPQPDLSALRDDVGTLPESDDYMPAVMQALHYFTEMMQYEQIQNPVTTRRPTVAAVTTRRTTPTTTTTRRTTTPTTTRRTTTPTTTRRTQPPTTTTRQITTTKTTRPPVTTTTRKIIRTTKRKNPPLTLTTTRRYSSTFSTKRHTTTKYPKTTKNPPPNTHKPLNRKIFSPFFKPLSLTHSYSLTTNDNLMRR